MQEGWTYEDAISDWFEVGKPPPSPQRKEEGEGEDEGLKEVRTKRGERRKR